MRLRVGHRRRAERPWRMIVLNGFDGGGGGQSFKRVS